MAKGAKTARPAVSPDSAQARLLALLRDNGPMSLAELGERLDLPRTRLVSEVDTLLASGLIQDKGRAPSRVGRPSTLLALDSAIRYGAIDLGATSIDIEITDGYLEPVAGLSEEVDVKAGPAAILQRITELFADLRRDGAFDRLNAIGIGVPGPVDVEHGMPISPPIMPGWDRYPLRATLEMEFGCPAIVDNDANIMSVGEKYRGIARNVRNYLFVKVGTGIGCGIHIDGRIYRGDNGCAGDIGHIRLDSRGPQCVCGNNGCLEAYFGGSALSRHAEAAARSGTSPYLAARLEAAGVVTARDVGKGAIQRDPVCLRLVRDGGSRLGEVLAGLISFINPSMIVIGGGLAELGNQLLAEVRTVIYQRSIPVATGDLPIVLSELGSRAGVTGAALIASDLLIRQP
ncbi:ROK family protein [Allorhizocola rhizosphaerae]|uniref:ROK family transcriptional regulator n=1 Tax=Allorhizocola rhizosphaerae TaxID=1872709 RepID=UPI003CCC54BD